MNYLGTYSSLGPGFNTNELKQTKRIPLPILTFFLTALILAGLSLGMFPKTFADYKIFRQAEERTKIGETSSALQELYEVQERHPNALPVTLELIELSMNAGYYDLAANVFNEYLVGKNLSNGQYARMMRCSKRLDSYYLTYDAIEDLMTKAVYKEAESQEALESRRNWLQEELVRLHSDEKQDQAFLYYYEGIIAQDQEEYYECLQKAYAEDPELFDVRVLLGNEERVRGNLTEARILLEAALAKEAQDEEALKGLAALDALEEDTL